MTRKKVVSFNISHAHASQRQCRLVRVVEDGGKEVACRGRVQLVHPTRMPAGRGLGIDNRITKHNCFLLCADIKNIHQPQLRRILETTQ
jgi:hypothetical protein